MLEIRNCNLERKTYKLDYKKIFPYATLQDYIEVAFEKHYMNKKTTKRTKTFIIMQS